MRFVWWKFVLDWTIGFNIGVILRALFSDTMVTDPVLFAIANAFNIGCAMFCFHFGRSTK